MPKVFTSKTQKRGEAGENVAVLWLEKHGFEIIDRNYTRKMGEIDIIAQNMGKLFFFEVKSIVTRESVSPETLSFRPEDNIHAMKLKRLYKTVEMFLVEHKVTKDWQIDLLCVCLYEDTKKARVTRVENI